MTKMKRSFSANFRNDFFTGIVILLPLFLTIVIVRFILTKVNSVLLDPILQLIKPTVGWAEERYLIIAVKIAIFLSIIFLIVLLGMLVKNFFIRKLIGAGEGFLLRVPFVNKIYSTIQQISSTFLTKKEAIFNKVVLVEYPRKGIFILGLFTSECEGKIAEDLPTDCVNVFIPTTPNPTSGFLIMVPRVDIKELDISVEEAMKMIVSGGVLTPKGKQLPEAH